MLALGIHVALIVRLCRSAKLENPTGFQVTRPTPTSRETPTGRSTTSPVISRTPSSRSCVPTTVATGVRRVSTVDWGHYRAINGHSTLPIRGGDSQGMRTYLYHYVSLAQAVCPC
nr:hypothetical protein Itr_chr05CG04540 [Ipomoea trifida]